MKPSKSGKRRRQKRRRRREGDSSSYGDPDAEGGKKSSVRKGESKRRRRREGDSSSYDDSGDEGRRKSSARKGESRRRRGKENKKSAKRRKSRRSLSPDRSPISDGSPSGRSCSTCPSRSNSYSSDRSRSPEKKRRRKGESRGRERSRRSRRQRRSSSRSCSTCSGGGRRDRNPRSTPPRELDSGKYEDEIAETAKVNRAIRSPTSDDEHGERNGDTNGAGEERVVASIETSGVPAEDKAFGDKIFRTEDGHVGDSVELEKKLRKKALENFMRFRRAALATSDSGNGSKKNHLVEELIGNTSDRGFGQNGAESVTPPAQQDDMLESSHPVVLPRIRSVVTIPYGGENNGSSLISYREHTPNPSSSVSYAVSEPHAVNEKSKLEHANSDSLAEDKTEIVGSRTAKLDMEPVNNNFGVYNSRDGVPHDSDNSQFKQKTFSRMHDGEMVQVSYKVYIPPNNRRLARRQQQS